MSDVVPAELRKLVSESLKCLGEVIEAKEGRKFFDEVEATRLLTRSLRDADDNKVFTELQKHFEKLLQLKSSQKLEALTKSFGLALELINVCETAYRSFRIVQSPTASEAETQNPTSVTWVFTAHPTEARTQETIEIFRRIQNLLIENLEGYREHFPSQELKFLLTLAWHADLAPTTKPTVEDEARHILHIVLTDDAQKMIANFARESQHRIRLRTWVGGDKDGHPGVGAKQTYNSLQFSREMIIHKLLALLDSAVNDLQTHRTANTANVHLELIRSIKVLKTKTKALTKLKAADGKKVIAWKLEFGKLATSSAKKIGTPFEQMLKIKSIVELFPSLVMPLEMREDSVTLQTICDQTPAKQKTYAIVQMLQKIRWLSGGAEQEYLQGLIISQCNLAQDFNNALHLAHTYLQDQTLPIIPLLENRHALETGANMVSEILQNKKVQKLAQNQWKSKLEVMVGYSDSAKEVGVLSSRYLIAKTLPEISKVCKTHALTPVFFHGSGGSISRGGGSTSEQCAWWPAEARARIKMTIQGEMVQRSFASGPILIQNLRKLLHQNQVTPPVPHNNSSALISLVAEQEKHYRELVSEPDFLKMISDATPYEYLQYLQIGSRPAKRKKLEGVSSLRAIPWVLCWTQTRSLLPIWWGLGSAWKSASAADKLAIQNDFKKSPLLSSYVKQLGFSLAKVEPGIWRMYLENLSTNPAYTKDFFRRFESEFTAVCDFVKTLSGSDDLLWFRPWLGASIRVRSPMIYPLHLAQLWALKNHDVSLMRQTVTAIASGMLTTG